MDSRLGVPNAATWQRLQAFLAICDTGSVGGAADVLQVTPPAVSAAVTALEGALDVKLFRRDGRGIAPTDAGLIFAGYARRLTGLAAEAVGAVHSADRGRIRVGAVTTASEYVLPTLLASFARRYPQVTLTLDVYPRDDLFARADDHELDVLVAGRPPRGSGLVTRARRPNELVVVGRPGLTDDPLSSPWLLTGRGSGTRDTALSLLDRLHATPPLLTLGTAGAVVAAAREGLGMALVHADGARDDIESGQLLVCPVPSTPLRRPWHLCTAREPTAATMLFVRHVCDPDQAGEAAFHTGARSTG